MSASDDDVPKLPRKWGLKLAGPEMFRIVITLALLIALTVLTKPCAHAVSTFVMGFDGSAKGSGSGAAMPKPGNVDMPAGSAAGQEPEYERLRPGMSEDEVKAAIERSKVRNAQRAAEGSAAAGSAAAGSAAGSATRGSAAAGSAAAGSAKPQH
jgi:hypothetical protein